MPHLSRTVPRYRKHRASGQAIVVLSGQGFYLGPYGTKTSKLEYDRLIAEWLARGQRPLADRLEESGDTKRFRSPGGNRGHDGRGVCG